MTSNRPYLIRALYEWIVDNHYTPYILLNADMPGVDVPAEYIEEGKIILNISPNAALNLRITNLMVEFSASFSGRQTLIYAPIKAVLAIYARENGRGMVFNTEKDEDDDDTDPPTPQKKSGQKPKITIVK